MKPSHSPWHAFTLVWIPWLLQLLRVPSYSTCTAFQKENFAVAVNGFTSSVVGLSRNTYKLRGKRGRTNKRSWPFVLNSPEDELFAGLRSPVLIQISSSFDDQNTFKNNHFDSKRWPIPGIKRWTNWDLKQTFSHATLVCYENSVNFDRLKGDKNVGTSRYFFAKSQCYVYGREQRTVQRKANIHDLVTGQWTLSHNTIKDKNITIRLRF